MKLISVAIIALMCSTGISAHAETETFDTTAPGALPPGWEAGVTGGGAPRWAVKADPSAPSPPNVLKQVGKGAYPCPMLGNCAASMRFSSTIG